MYCGPVVLFMYVRAIVLPTDDSRVWMQSPKASKSRLIDALFIMHPYCENAGPDRENCLL